MKNLGPPWEEGEIRLEVDKIHFYHDSFYLIAQTFKTIRTLYN